MIEFLDTLLFLTRFPLIISALALVVLGIIHAGNSDLTYFSDHNEKQLEIIAFFTDKYVASFIVILAMSFMTTIVLEYVYDKKIREEIVKIVNDESFKVEGVESSKALDSLRIDLGQIQKSFVNRDTGDYTLRFKIVSKQDTLKIRLFRQLDYSNQFWVYVENYSKSSDDPIGIVKSKFQKQKKVEK